MPCSTNSRLLRHAFVLAALLGLSACADGTPAPVSTSVSPQDRSPLATPPASMMTPHGY